MSQEPYEFQRSVSALFNEGKDMLIQAPTGAGKTRAVLEPGWDGLAYDLDHKSTQYPPRILYAVPMRTLARGFYDVYAKTAHQNEWETILKPRIQTGEQQGDDKFEGKLIFATVDQILASFLNVPFGLPRSLDNINAGALIGSYLIFDEVHLYPRKEMLLTTLAMLTMLKGVSRFAMMSATLSRPFLDAMAHVLDADVIAENDPPASSRFEDVDSVRTQQRTWHAQEGMLTAEVVEHLRGERILCICNTVDRTQRLYAELRDLLPDVEIVLLHSRFYPQDRRVIEDHLLRQDETSDHSYFECQHNIILVATQVVEVGLDISANVLLTECAPASSLIQRAGRCARRENEAGDIYVFQPYDDEGLVNYAPYIEDGFEEVCRKTWEALTDSTFNGQVLRFADEQRLVDRAHGEADGEFLDGLQSKVETQIEIMTKAIRERDPGAPTNLIRKSTTFPLYITVHDDPNQDDNLTEHPQMLQGFSLSKGALSHFYKRLEEEQQSDLPFLLAGSDGSAQASSDDDGQTESSYRWAKLRDKEEVWKQRWYVANQWAIQYHPKIGLRLLPATDTPAPPSPKAERRPYDRIAYAAERYHEHIQGLSSAYQRPHNVAGFTPLRDEALYPLRRLCELYGLDLALAEQLLRLTLALHDVGKLNRPWQDWAGEWQKAYAATGLSPTRTAADLPLAHTDYDPSDPGQYKLQHEDFHHAPRGTHAVESAEACLPVIRAASGGDKLWLAVVASAIMHHHTPDAATCRAFRMIDGADAALRAAFSTCGFAKDADNWLPKIQCTFSESSPTLQKYVHLVQPTYDDWRAALLYFLFVRILRLADQRSMSYWAHFRDLPNEA